jgi:hypothetical protein
MKIIWLLSAYACLIAGCRNEYVENPDIPPAIICEVCEVTVSKTASHCKNCQHPVEQSIDSHSRLNRDFILLRHDRNENAIKQRKENFEKFWGKELNETKLLDELDQISFPHIIINRIDSNFTLFVPRKIEGFEPWPNGRVPNPHSVLLEGNQTFNGKIRSGLSVVEVKDGLLNGRYRSWQKGAFDDVVKFGTGWYNNGKKHGHFDQYFDYFDINRRVSHGKFIHTQYVNGIAVSEVQFVSVPQWSLSVKKKKNSAYRRYQGVAHGEAVLRDLNNTIISKQYFDHGRLLSAIAWLPDGSIDKRVNVKYGNGSILTDAKELYTFKDGYHVESEIGLLGGPIEIRKRPATSSKGQKTWTVESVQNLMIENNCSAKQLIRELNKQSKTGSIFSEDLKISTLLEIFYDHETKNQMPEGYEVVPGYE